MKNLVKGIVGCAFATAIASSAATAQTTIRMWTFLDPAKTSGREIALKNIIAEFEKNNPGIRVRVEPQIFSELMSKFLAANGAGTAPDIVWVNTENMGALANSGAGADLEQLFIKSWPKDQVDDFFVRAGWDAGLKDGKRYAVPLFHASTSLFYRKDLFAAAGIKAEDIRTWDDLAEAAKKLTVDKDKDGRIDIWGFGTPLSTERTGGTTAFTTLFASAGSMWVNCKAQYNTDLGRRALMWHVDLIEKHKAMPREAISNTADDVIDQFLAGRYAIAVMPFARFDSVRKDATWDGNQLAILPWPNWTRDRLGPQQVQGWYGAVWARSPRIKEAGRFLEHMVSPYSVKEWSTTGGQVPTRYTIWQEPEFRQPKYHYMATAVQAWKDWSFQINTECNSARFDADLNLAAQRVLVSKTTPEAAMIEAEKTFLSRQQ